MDGDDLTDGGDENGAQGGRKSSISRRRKFSQPLLVPPVQDEETKPRSKTVGVGDAADPEALIAEARRQQAIDAVDPELLRVEASRQQAVDVMLTPENQMVAVDEARVADETEQVVKSFMVSSYQRSLRQTLADGTEPDSLSSPLVAETPSIPEFQNFPDNPLNPSILVGRRLALIGNDIEQRYGSDLDQLVHLLLPNLVSDASNVTIQQAYEAFKRVAQKLFEHGNITWGRVIALLCFGYRMALALFRRGINFIVSVVKLVAKFIVMEKIARWIAGRGGWAAAMNYHLEAEAPGSLVNFTSYWFWGLLAATVAIAFMSRSGAK